jgi:hypothetical protein
MNTIERRALERDNWASALERREADVLKATPEKRERRAKHQAPIETFRLCASLFQARLSIATWSLVFHSRSFSS